MIPLLGAVLCGLLLGQLLTLVALRLPRRMQWDLERDVALAHEELGREPVPPVGERPTLLRRGPECLTCGTSLSGAGAVPVVGYLLRNGRCRACGATLPLTGPVVELVLAGAFLALVLQLGATPTALAAAVLVSMLVTLAAIDGRERLLPDALTLPGLWLGLVLNAFGLFVDPTSAILGAAGGYGFLAGSQWLFGRLTGREGIAAGDHKLLAMIGAWLGWQVLPAVLLLALTSAAVLLVLTRILRRTGGPDARTEVAFGPYLVAGALVLLCGGAKYLSALIL
ncbi:A24 family peptidase [Myxococcota bacterium]|nr:A24 family peptidase [Myxococcota bacterium]